MICFRPRPRPRPRCHAGFTLIELLVVIAIIGVLSAITIATVGHVRHQARITACRSNLRQAGVAMLNYAADSRDRLPGPLWRGQGPFYNADGTGSFNTGSGNLADFIVPYFGLPPPPRLPEPGTRSDALTCPAWLTTDHEAKTYLCYYSTGELGDGEATGQFPFGRCSSNAQSIVPTMLISQLPDPAATLALREFDRRQMPEDSDSFYATDPRVPQHPVHGETRNALYFDGHVSAIP